MQLQLCNIINNNNNDDDDGAAAVLTYIGVAERLLRVDRSAAARLRQLLCPPQDQQHKRAKDAVDGKRHFHNPRRDSSRLIVSGADAVSSGSSGRPQRRSRLLRVSTAAGGFHA